MNDTPASVLVIDDEVGMRDVLAHGLVHYGFRVRTAGDGFDGLRVLGAERVDAIVLDVKRPKVDGISLIPILRRSTEAPILMLSARRDVSSVVAGLEAGADDYLAKPFDFEELSARLRSALRRPVLKGVATIAFADLVIDVGCRKVERGGELIELTAREFDLLVALTRVPERVYTRAELIELVWGARREVGTGTVETYVCYLRAKVDAPPRRRLIHTIHGVGYSIR